MKPEDVGIVGFKGDADKQPFMVGYFQSSGVREKKIRQKRDTGAGWKKSDSSSFDIRNSNLYSGIFFSELKNNNWANFYLNSKLVNFK